MKILITGGAGFVGANLAIYLAGRGNEVTSLDNLVRRGSEMNLPRLKSAGVKFIHGDCRNKEDIPLDDWDAICHTAAQPSAIDGNQQPTFDLQNNVAGLFPILDLCRETYASLVFWASNKVYPCVEIAKIYSYETPESLTLTDPANEYVDLNGNDRSLYGATKLAGEILAREYGRAFGFPVYINRFSCLAGPWQWGKTEQGWVAWWVIAHRLGFPLTYYGFNGKQTRDILYIDDVCSLVEKQIQASAALTKETNLAGVYNVGGGVNNVMSLIQATRFCQEITGETVEINKDAPERPCDFQSYVSDISMVSKTFDWVPTVSPYSTLERIDRWVVDNLDTLKALYL